jgi:metallophosphoesterase (TIGR00282 family)
MVVVDVSGMHVAVINLQGRQNMGPLDCPFQVGKGLVEKARRQTKLILVDFHAELCEEKEALGLFLDGRVSMVVGTHTHVQTMDNKILPKGTGYITDLGMCGPFESVIGSEPMVSIQRQMTQMPLKNKVAASSACIQGIVCSIDPRTGNTVSLDVVNEQYHV